MGSGGQSFGVNGGRDGSALLATDQVGACSSNFQSCVKGRMEASRLWAEEGEGGTEVRQQVWTTVLQSSAVRERRGGWEGVKQREGCPSALRWGSGAHVHAKGTEHAETEGRGYRSRGEVSEDWK